MAGSSHRPHTTSLLINILHHDGPFVKLLDQSRHAVLNSSSHFVRDFFSWHLECFFSVTVSSLHPVTTCCFVVMSPRAPFRCESCSNFLCFLFSRKFCGKLVRLTCRLFLKGNFKNVFPMFQLGLLVWGRKARGKFHCYHLLRVYTINMTLLLMFAVIIWLREWPSDLPNVNLLPSLPYSGLCKKVTMQLTVKQ